jgi:hypothetical protein
LLIILHLSEKCKSRCGQKMYFLIKTTVLTSRGPGSSVGIATGYRLDGPGIESRWGRNFPHLSIPVLGPTQPPVQWYRVFPGGIKRPGRDADPLPPSSAEVYKQSKAIPLLSLRAFVACKKGATYLLTSRPFDCTARGGRPARPTLSYALKLTGIEYKFLFFSPSKTPPPPRRCRGTPILTYSLHAAESFLRS